MRSVPAPIGRTSLIEKVVLAERLREVRALAGFTRIESPGDWDEVTEIRPDQRAPLARRPPVWLPAAEVRGEGIFIHFRESALFEWEQRTGAIADHQQMFREAHAHWRKARQLSLPDPNWIRLQLRYVLLHSFAHALMRQLALECGYAVASIRERIYSLPPEAEEGPMAGVLLYTSAPDSEGTLGGLVSLGEPAVLGRQIDEALDRVRLCASDPLCAEHHPFRDGTTLHAAACHACLFAPETSCERGNKYLDRAVLIPTLSIANVAFFR